MRELRIEPLPLRRIDSGWLRGCRVERWSDGRCEDSNELVYEVPSWVTPPDDADCDGYVRALLLDAMSERRKLVVHGEVSITLRGNLDELQGMWSRWKPGDYSIVPVEARAVNESKQRVDGAVCAFSGGVDASFTLWRHATGRCGFRNQQIKAAVLVHGFDIPLSDDLGIEQALNTGNAMTGDLGVPLALIRTNFREVVEAKWLDVFGLAVVSAMDQMKRHAGTCLIASCEPYGCLVEALGSTPMSDHLMSGGGLDVIHDGATHSRIDKIHELVGWPAGIRRLRVCFQKQAHGHNCGKCEKCVRNKMCFLVCGMDVPDNFPK